MAVSSKANEALWFKDAIIYEVSVRAFFDSDGDGIGDFQGLIRKLDYLDDLGINTIWLLPFFPSPLRDDGFDVTEYCDVHPDYGTLGDFKQFLKEAHRRNIKVITELILNHTSDQHPWFKRSRKAKAGSRFRDMYVWSDSPDKYREARVIVPDEDGTNWTWDPVARAWYWHRFYKHQPELNFDSADVQLEVFKIVDFWLKLGVDGFRLGSVPFLFEEEGTSSENLPQTHTFLRKLRSHIDRSYRNRILIAEANLWPEDAAAYFGGGSECHMNFHYPLMPRMFLALRTEDSYPIIDIIEQTPEVPETNQWAVFLRNHDELGLETVTEEEKDYLTKAFNDGTDKRFNVGIRRRLAPLMNNDRRKIELLHAILFSLPGTPVLYYGDEIGMGDNVYLGDRYGMRTPMQWNLNPNAGFSTANPQRLYLPIITDPVYRHESVNVATQESSHASLLWWIRNVVAMRKRIAIFGRGKMKFIETSNARVLAFVRSYEGLHVVTVANLSQFPQSAILSLNEFRGSEVIEVFSQNRFQSVDTGAYPITIGPYGYFWFQLEVAAGKERSGGGGELGLIETDVSWERLFDHYNEVRTLERKIFPPFMRKCRWFGGKAKSLSNVSVNKAIPLKVGGDTHFLLILEVQYVQRLPEFYFLPLVFIPADRTELEDHTTQRIACRAVIQNTAGFIMDSSYDKAFRDFLFSSMSKELKLRADAGATLHFNSSVFARIDQDKIVDSRILKTEQSNTSVIYNNQYFFKFYRKLEKEVNPELEVVRFLSEQTSFQHSPRYAGSFEYRDNEDNVIVFGLLQELVANQGDAWTMTLDAVGEYLERVEKADLPVPAHTSGNRLQARFDDTPEPMQKLIGREFYDRIVKLAQRTAEMHQALASDKSNPAFAPEEISPNYQRSLYASFRKLVRDRFTLLEANIGKLPPVARELAEKILSQEEIVLSCFAEITQYRIKGSKTRVHGDYHLGQVLFTGSDFVIIDFEGEPAVSFNERRLKKSPFKDVAGMMRSIQYAAFGAILLNKKFSSSDVLRLQPWAEQWQHYVSQYYLKAYLQAMNMDMIMSKESDVLLNTLLLEKAIYELGYELNGRPDWTIIPLRGIDYLVQRYIDVKVKS